MQNDAHSLQPDLVVFGGGSGGFGAALAAARAGLDVLLVEKTARLGGNATRCGVNNWEPVAGGTGFPFEVYKRLKNRPGAVGIYSYGRHCLWDGFDVIPGGEHIVDPRLAYVDTTVRHGMRSLADDEAFAREKLHGVCFEPADYEEVLRAMLGETGKCAVRYETSFSTVRLDSGRIESVRLSDDAEVIADYYIDATGDGELCAAAGCEIMIGQEAKERFGEPSAPDEANDRINGVTLMYRITRRTTGGSRDTGVIVPGETLAECRGQADFPAAAIFELPSGDRNINMLPTMEGREYLSMPHEQAYAECRRRVLAHWRWMQTNYPEYREYEIRSIAEAIGVRESRRVVGEYVLTESDITDGIRARRHHDTVAIADHALDRHGEKGGTKELDEPFAIPYRCLIPKGFSNLLVACRASSFSSIAASSCRLSRTMMQLGQAAGTATAIAGRRGCALPDVPP